MQPAKHYSSKARVSRADLLLSLKHAGVESLETVAEMCGYAAPLKRSLKLQIPELVQTQTEVKPQSELEKTEAPAVEDSPIHYYRVIERKPSELLPAPSSSDAELPGWYHDIPELDVDSVKPANLKPPPKEPLLTWAKLWPVLQALLSELKRSRKPDIVKLAALLARAEIPLRIPRQVRESWTASVQVLVDRPERTELFNDDYNQLLSQLKLLRGVTGLQVQQLLHRPGGLVRVKQAEHYHTQPWRLPESGAALLIISDLGVLDRCELAMQDWLSFGRKLRTAGLQPWVLFPLPQRYLTPELINLFACVCWGRQSDLRPVLWVAQRGAQQATALQQDSLGAANDLLAWLSPAVRVEPALLRAVRQRLPIANNDAGVEAATWLHEDVQVSNIGFYYKADKIAKHRQRFKELAQKYPELALTLVRLLREYHCHVFPTQLHEEMLILADLLEEKLGDAYQVEIQAASEHWLELLKALDKKTPGTAGLPGFTRHYFKRQHDSIWQNPNSQHLPAMWGVLLRETMQGGKLTLPKFIEESPAAKKLALRFLNSKEDRVLDYVLFQRGTKILQLASRQFFLAGDDGFKVGSKLADFSLNSQYVLQQRCLEDSHFESTLICLEDDISLNFEIDSGKRQHIHIAGEELVIERYAKPIWTSAFGHINDEMLVTTKSFEKQHSWYWHPAVIGLLEGSEVFEDEDFIRSKKWCSHRGFWYYQSRDRGLKPDWADSAGRDQYGLYAEAFIAGISQRFRWIEPGSFLMGSPEDKPEIGRHDDEIQHQVILSRGYWLADTACTQAVWQAVMGKNPSQFKGADLPVETVSWDEVQQFIQRINQQQPELELRLPSEAEWEYACRAGTEGAFNFAAELSLSLVNYRGTWEYESDKWGEGALRQTSAVKCYSANAWGLYEMHGNVWEWCQDWFGEYPAELVTDPAWPEIGRSRVLRGGSWDGYGRRCRSACRYHIRPDIAYGSTGFRLARGHELSQPSSVKAGADRQPAGGRASKTRGSQTGDGLRGGAASGGGENKAQKKSKGILGKMNDLFKK